MCPVIIPTPRLFMIVHFITIQGSCFLFVINCGNMSDFVCVHVEHEKQTILLLI